MSPIVASRMTLLIASKETVAPDRDAPWPHWVLWLVFERETHPSSYRCGTIASVVSTSVAACKEDCGDEVSPATNPGSPGFRILVYLLILLFSLCLNNGKRFWGLLPSLYPQVILCLCQKTLLCNDIHALTQLISSRQSDCWQYRFNCMMVW